MPPKKLATSKPGPATQQYLDIEEIRDDMVIMKDGTSRAVLYCASINFALKSEEEQEAIVQAYISFLNSLETPIQIVVQSRKMNIDGYLTSLADYEKKSTNELLQAQIADYRNFVQELVELGDIMQKKFFVVVLYDPKGSKRKNFFERLSIAISPVLGLKLKEDERRRRKEELEKHINIVRAQLNSMSVTSTTLDTQGLIELYYSCYNPDVYDTETLGDISRIRVE
jgi:hypothetical protein